MKINLDYSKEVSLALVQDKGVVKPVMTYLGSDKKSGDNVLLIWKKLLAYKKKMKNMVFILGKNVLQLTLSPKYNQTSPLAVKLTGATVNFILEPIILRNMAPNLCWDNDH